MHPARSERGAELVAHQRVEPAHHVGLRAVAADVLGAGEALLEKAEEGRVGLPLGGPVRDGEVAQAHQDGEGGDGEEGDDTAHTPVRSKQHDHDPNHHQRVAEDLKDELREEVGERCDVAVDPLDHLARRVRLVEGEIEVDGMGQQVDTETIGGGPAHILGDVGCE